MNPLNRADKGEDASGMRICVNEIEKRAGESRSF